MLAGTGYLFSQRGSANRAGGRGAAQPGGVPVSVDVVRRGNMPVYISAIGTVTPVYTVTLTSRVAGKLMSIHYTEGQIVEKGQLLAEIDPRPYEAAYMQAQGQLARDQAQLANARVDLQRYSMTVAQHAVPEQTYATQQATVAQDEGTVKVDEGNLAAAKVNLDYARITAPISGTVGLRSVDPGNIVQANGTTGLVTIAQLQPITVIFPMAEDSISDVEHAMRAGREGGSAGRRRQRFLGRSENLLAARPPVMADGIVCDCEFTAETQRHRENQGQIREHRGYRGHREN